MRKATFAFVITAALVVPSVAQAHTLSLRRAHKQTVRIERRVCKSHKNCKRYGALGCSRITQHRVKCFGWEEYKSPKGAKSVCSGKWKWRLLPNGGEKVHAGPVHCASGWPY